MEFITRPETEEEALLIFWAADSISRDQHQLAPDIKKRYEQNRLKLEELRKKILLKELKWSLSSFSHGFVLGVLEFSARATEASIEHFHEHKKIVHKLESWKTIGFPSEKFEKHWEHAMTGIKEIQSWLKDRSDAFFPVVAAIIRSGKYGHPPKILKALRKGRSDKVAFQILSSVLQTNPLLNELLVDLCKIEGLVISNFKNQCRLTLELLKNETAETKVRDYCELILGKLSTISR